MKKLIFLLLCRVASLALMGVAMPAYSGDKICGFQAKGLSINFGTLNPSTGADVTTAVSASTLNADKAGDCVSSVTMKIDGDNGLNFSGSRRLKNAAGTDFIPYSLAGLPQSSPGPGNNRYQTFTFNGIILGSAYANASAGSYSDTVIISVTP